MELTTPVGKLPFIGPVFARRLSRINIKTLEDLLYHFPHRYEDFSIVSPISQVQLGETVTIQGKILAIKNEFTKRRLIIQKATVEDNTGTLEVVWFNQRYLPRTLFPGTHVSLAGKIAWFGKKLVMESPEFEKVENRDSRFETIHTGRLVPIYPETSRVSSKWLRSRIAQFLPEATIEEFLPGELIKMQGLLPLNPALEAIHFPKTLKDAQEARERFSFEEFFLLQLTVLDRKKFWNTHTVCWNIKVPESEIANLLSKLPFELTRAQKRAIEEIAGDLEKRVPMNRLLEGDVGSGKTVVAAIGAFISVHNKLQVAVMAPTQILALQHFQTFQKLLEPFGITVKLITGNSKKEEGEWDVVIGTHALLYKKTLFKKLGLVVVDEQHKFGVRQRAELLSRQKDGGCIPHVLTMTATPIPRTVALTLYGDLELSLLDELPPGRQKITTWVVPPKKRDGAYNWIRDHINSGSQVFIVCPLIEESEIENMKTVKAATVEFERLSKEVFPELKLGLLHGRLKANGKEEIINKFRDGKTHILVATPVVEVGIDIPNATIMMIEAADRFGLAQLHQLRGRVGRGEKKSYCLLFTESTSDKVLARLHAMEESKTGAELAELDLRLRGPGELFGTEQHGFPGLKIASFSDLPLIKKTKDAAEAIFPNLKKYPKLSSRLKTHLVVPN
ncbi:ATP-dependent DNA helicase RecG [Candidatus Microgenomates bacterium]|nr:ATP-dependent DNA helicase RecG [Candidatus Microgenomates bacterium]